MSGSEIKEWLFGQCDKKAHASCMGRFRAVKTADNHWLPELRCTCDCHKGQETEQWGVPI